MDSKNSVENLRKKKNISCLVLISLIALLILTTFDFVFPIKQIFLGAFGVMLYPIIFFAGLFCVGILKNKQFVYSWKYLIYLFLGFFFLMCILHISLTENAKTLSYSDYLASCYYSIFTPGGVIIGAFTYPISALFHSFAGVIFYAILFVIDLYFILNYLEGVKKQRILLAKKIQEDNKYNNFVNLSRLQNFESESYGHDVTENVDEDDKDDDGKKIEDSEDDTEITEASEEESEKLEEPQKIDEDDLIIKDPDSTIEAKEKLGLVKKVEEPKELTPREILFPKNDTEDNWQNRGVNFDSTKAFLNNSGINLKKENPMLAENKKYLSSLYQYNLDSNNPIINAENYKDFKEKMEEIKRQNTQPFVRELDVNQTLEPSKNTGKIQDTKNVVNFEGQNKGLDLGRNNISPTPISQNNGNSVRNLGMSSFENEKNVQNSNNLSVDEIGKFTINGLENDFDLSMPKWNTINSEVKKENEEKPFDTSKLSLGNIENSLGNTVNLKQQPSNVYNLPKNFKNSDYKQLEMLGTQKDSKPEPQFRYDSKYVRPPIDLLETYINEEDLSTDHKKNIEILERVLDEFKIPAKVEAVRRGAAVTRYELHMPVGIPVRKIHQHASDIALALASPGEIRIETPIKGKSAVGVEVPNRKIDKVGFKDIIATNEFQNAKKPLTFALGKDIDGSIYCCDLASMPHMLVAGSTGSGKSVCLNTLLLSLIFRTSPEDLRLILVDPKRVEFAIYNGLPHLLLPKAITEPKKALNAFDWLINEMERRFMVFQECYVKNIGEYNSQPDVLNKKFPKLPYLVLVVDELADLVVTTNKKELEEKIIRLTQKARAAGIHVILATQRPSVDIITGSIKINLPSRIAFAVTSFVDSKTILDQGGAEKLLGRGDMLYSPQASEPVRVQGAFVDTPEVRRVVEFVKNNNPATFDESLQRIIDGESGPVGGASVGASGGEEFDSLMPDALKLVIENGQASISMLQRRFSIGFSRAARIIDQMEVAKFISSSDGSKPRTVYITMEDYEQLYGNGN